VQALAGSIRLQGILVPVVVSPATDEVAAGGWEFELVAGFHRVAAAAQLGLTEIPVVVRLGETVDSDRAIARSKISPEKICGQTTRPGR
jgi:ParB-like chromosome segregation protein Spo0J